MLIIVRGLPGSGKSTYVRNNFPGIFHIENDMFHIHDGKYCYDKSKQWNAVAWCFNTVKIALKHGMDVVVSNTFTKKDFIQGYVNICEETKTPYKVIRMENRFGNIHNVPEEVYANMEKGFEDWEGEEIIKG